ncbi:hypothetical protein [Treponema sp.]|uniref:hypothetical protein n=1 Tax=Treponema sp. TaxID=166 RepID=UPI003FA27329
MKYFYFFCCFLAAITFFACSKSGAPKAENAAASTQEKAYVPATIKGDAHSANPLLKADFVEANVVNGAGTVLGVRAYVKVCSADFNKLTLADYAQFCAFFSEQPQKYKWVSIISDNNEGICFAGGGTTGMYGKIDKEGAVVSSGDWAIYYDPATQTATKE